MGPLDSLTTVARAAHLAALVSLFGCLVFAAAVPSGPPGRIGRTSLAAALITWALWFGASAGEVAGADGLGATIRAVPVVLSQTSFGQAAAIRLAALVALAALWRLPRLSIPLAGVALGVQALLGHVGAMEGSQRLTLVAVEGLHLLAAGAWLGGLIPLWLAIRRAPPDRAAALCARFTPIGLVAVGMIAATALPLAAALAGGFPALIGTAHGRVILLKVTLFLLALGLASLNRFVLAARSRRWLTVSIAAEAGAGLGLLIAAASLASLPPGIHVQPDWPFPWRPSLAAWREPELRAELGERFGAIALAAAAAGASLILRRFRLIAAVTAGAVLIWVAPSASLLFVEAWPTSFATSPTGFSVETIAQGEILYAAHCAACHDPQAGTGGAGDLWAEHLWAHWDGELLWRLRHGAADARGALRMPGFEATIPEDGLWALIDAVRARNIGHQIQQNGRWSPPVRAPAMPLVCAAADGTVDGGDGDRPALILAGPATSSTAGRDLRIVRLARGTVPGPEPGACAAATPLAWDAWAVLAGLPPGGLAGYRAVVDAGGWLRAVLPPEVSAEQVAAAAAGAWTPAGPAAPMTHKH